MRAASFFGSEASTSRMLAWWAACVTLTSRLAPFTRETRAPVAAVSLGVNASLLHSPTWKGLETLCSVSALDPGTKPLSCDSVASAPQLVGLNRKLGRLTVTSMLRRRSGTPCTIVGSAAVTTARPLYRPTPIAARVITLPKSKGPALAGTTIERP